MKNILITGAAGFIGNALWKRWGDKYNLIGLDDMSRETAIAPRPTPQRESILFFKDSLYSEDPFFEKIISSSGDPLDAIIHLGAQVSVTDSVKDPIRDCRTNIEGTLRMCMLAQKYKCKLIYSSTNKVFGSLENVKSPILDDRPLMPSTPYGISKCAGAQYVLDMLPEKGFVFHQSCIYGETQVGTVDQGWVGWLRNCIKREEPITCFGDGTQVRDLLHVEDLINIYEMVINEKLLPGAYVTGGGEENAYSFADVMQMLEGQVSKYDEWRPSDQRYFVSANEGLTNQGWKPDIKFPNWLNQNLLKK